MIKYNNATYLIENVTELFNLNNIHTFPGIIVEISPIFPIIVVGIGGQRQARYYGPAMIQLMAVHMKSIIDNSEKS